MLEKTKESPDQLDWQEGEKLERERQLMEELKQKRNDLYQINGLDFYEQISIFVKKLQEFPDYERYKLYHLLLSSSIKENKSNEFDFPGEFSIEGFLKISDEEREEFIKKLAADH